MRRFWPWKATKHSRTTSQYLSFSFWVIMVSDPSSPSSISLRPEPCENPPGLNHGWPGASSSSVPRARLLHHTSGNSPSGNGRCPGERTENAEPATSKRRHLDLPERTTRSPIARSRLVIYQRKQRQVSSRDSDSAVTELLPTFALDVPRWWCRNRVQSHCRNELSVNSEQSQRGPTEHARPPCRGRAVGRDLSRTLLAISKAFFECA